MEWITVRYHLKKIDFPTKVIVNNNKHVTMDPSLAATMTDLNLDKGWLILDSREVSEADYKEQLEEEQKKNRTIFTQLS